VGREQLLYAFLVNLKSLGILQTHAQENNIT
jgi:hypothetical protein